MLCQIHRRASSSWLRLAVISGLRGSHQNLSTPPKNFKFFATDAKDSTKKGKKHNKSNKKVTDVELSFEEESDEYILKELKKEIKSFKSKNKQIPQIVSQFKDILQLYKYELIQCPVSSETEIKAENTTHLRKVTQTGETIDLLMDFKTSEDLGSREIQVVITNENKKESVLYMMGSFSQENGFMFDSSMFIKANSYNKTEDIRDSICKGKSEIFKSLNNHYHKSMNIDDEKMIEFLSIDETNPEAQIPEFENGRSFVDAMVNYTVIEMLEVKNSDVEGRKLRTIMWMLGTYCENALYGAWLEELTKFIEKK